MPAGDAEHQREGDGEPGQLDGHRQPLEDQRDHRLAGAPGRAEVALRELAEPASRTARHHGWSRPKKRLSSATIAGLTIGVGADHLLDDRAGNQPQHQEDQHRQPHQREGHRVQPDDQVARHAIGGGLDGPLLDLPHTGLRRRSRRSDPPPGPPAKPRSGLRRAPASPHCGSRLVEPDALEAVEQRGRVLPKPLTVACVKSMVSAEKSQRCGTFSRIMIWTRS